MQENDDKLEKDKQKPIQSLAQYISTIKRYSAHSAYKVFRGHSDKTWSLHSSGDRSDLEATQYHEIWLDCYKNKYHKEITEKSYLKSVVTMQHYGIPTKFLDWTYNPLIALYFAVEQYNNIDGRVIIALPDKIYEPDTELLKKLETYLGNLYSGSESDKEKRELLEQLNFRNRMYFCVSKSNDRIKAQSGLFSIDFYTDIEDCITKEINILIDTIEGKERKKNIFPSIIELKNRRCSILPFIKEKEYAFDHHGLYNQGENYYLKKLIDEIRKKWFGRYLFATIVENTIDLIVDHSCKDEIKRDLKNLCSIDEQTVYPDLMGYANYINQKYKKKHEFLVNEKE